MIAWGCASDDGLERYGGYGRERVNESYCFTNQGGEEKRGRVSESGHPVPSVVIPLRGNKEGCF